MPLHFQFVQSAMQLGLPNTCKDYRNILLILKLNDSSLNVFFSGDGGDAVSNCCFEIYAEHKNVARGLNAEGFNVEVVRT